jgi:6-phosphofructokinase 1
MVIIKRVSSKPYKIELALAPVDQVANAEKKVPTSMIAGKTHMDKSFREYLEPLIQGEVYPKFENGIYKTAVLKKVKAR